MKHLKGKDFEKLLVDRFTEYGKNGMASIGRYGVQAAQFGSKPEDVRVMASLPDFEGLAEGVDSQIIFDAKVCSQASFALAPYRPESSSSNKERQLRHMRNRSKFGALCAFLIHWNARQLKTKSEPAETFWFPVESNDFWEQFDRWEIRSITRDDCRQWGWEVQWGTLTSRGRTDRPLLLESIWAKAEV